MSVPTNAAIVDVTSARKWDPFRTVGDAASGYVTYDETKGEIHIPYGTDPVSIMVQSHELAHVRYTSQLWRDAARDLAYLRTLAGTTSGIVGYAEDMRITALAGRLGIKTLPSLKSKDDAVIIDRWVESFIAAGVPEGRVRAALNYILTQHTAVLKTLGMTVAQLQQKTNAERYVIHCAKLLHNLLSKGEQPKQQPTTGDSKKADKSQKSDKSESKKSEPKPADADESEDEKQDDNSADKSDDAEENDDHDGIDEAEIDLRSIKLPDMKDAMVASVPAPEDSAKLVQDFQHILDTTDWVKVPSIERMPLVRRTAIARRRGLKASETGVALRSAYDAVSPNERRPFVGKRKSGISGLTVLIDCSGSMQIQEHQIERLLQKHPQGVVVTYSTKPDYTGGKAVVRIIASHGRMSQAKDFRDISAGMNACDGPVLQWLSKQPGERIWVCDGVISKKHDMMVPYDYNAMAAWLKLHKVTRFRSLNEYLRNLAKKG